VVFIQHGAVDLKIKWKNNIQLLFVFVCPGKTKCKKSFREFMWFRDDP
jgi:hypothetical protein